MAVEQRLRFQIVINVCHRIRLRFTHALLESTFLHVVHRAVELEVVIVLSANFRVVENSFLSLIAYYYLSRFHVHPMSIVVAALWLGGVKDKPTSIR